jgi:hypothetical protein
MEQDHWVFVAGGAVALASGHRVRRLLTGECRDEAPEAIVLDAFDALYDTPDCPPPAPEVETWAFAVRAPPPPASAAGAAAARSPVLEALRLRLAGAHRALGDGRFQDSWDPAAPEAARLSAASCEKALEWAAQTAPGGAAAPRAAAVAARPEGYAAPRTAAAPAPRSPGFSGAEAGGSGAGAGAPAAAPAAAAAAAAAPPRKRKAAAPRPLDALRDGGEPAAKWPPPPAAPAARVTPPPASARCAGVFHINGALGAEGLRRRFEALGVTGARWAWLCAKVRVALYHKNSRSSPTASAPFPRAPRSHACSPAWRRRPPRPRRRRARARRRLWRRRPRRGAL